jgi:hypothetical protein
MQPVMALNFRNELTRQIRNRNRIGQCNLNLRVSECPVQSGNWLEKTRPATEARREIYELKRGAPGNYPGLGGGAER